MNQKNIAVFVCVIIVIVIISHLCNIQDSFSSNNDMYNIKDLSSKGVEGVNGAVGPQGPRGPPGSNAVFPKGVIVSWYGSASSIPKGWTVCNGTNGTPDLRDRFILGAGPKYKINRKGGEASVRLTGRQLPIHSHSYQDVYWSEHRGWRSPPGASRKNVPGSLGSRRGQDSDNAGYQFRRQTSNSGGNQPHNNMPPFQALLFIMKL
jgi:microcystin-dependent protein